ELVDAPLLSRLKPTAYLINTSRGGLIREQDLAQALREGRIAGAGLDVLSQEPPPVEHPLLKAPNCLITPHLAWSSRRARQRLVDTVGENFAAYLRGEKLNVVSE
ncbi:MAG: NAD(P)-dependent oxidoreductase, partial [Bacteroidota bacterium]